MIKATKNVFQHPEEGFWCYTITVDGTLLFQQDFDWEQTGLMESEARAVELADKQIEMMKATKAVPNPEQRILQLEQENADLRAELSQVKADNEVSSADTTTAILDLYELLNTPT